MVVLLLLLLLPSALLGGLRGRMSASSVEVAARFPPLLFPLDEDDGDLLRATRTAKGLPLATPRARASPTAAGPPRVLDAARASSRSSIAKLIELLLGQALLLPLLFRAAAAAAVVAPTTRKRSQSIIAPPALPPPPPQRDAADGDDEVIWNQAALAPSSLHPGSPASTSAAGDAAASAARGRPSRADSAAAAAARDERSAAAASAALRRAAAAAGVSWLALGQGDATARTPRAEEGSSAPHGIRGAPAKKRRRSGPSSFVVVVVFPAASFLSRPPPPPPANPYPLAAKGIPRSASPITRGAGGFPSRIDAQRQAQASRSAWGEGEDEGGGEEAEQEEPPPPPPATTTVAASPGLRLRGHHDLRGRHVLGSTATTTIEKKREGERVKRRAKSERKGKGNGTAAMKGRREEVEQSARGKADTKGKKNWVHLLRARLSLALEPCSTNAALQLGDQEELRALTCERSPDGGGDDGGDALELGVVSIFLFEDLAVSVAAAAGSDGSRSSRLLMMLSSSSRVPFAARAALFLDGLQGGGFLLPRRARESGQGPGSRGGVVVLERRILKMILCRRLSVPFDLLGEHEASVPRVQQAGAAAPAAASDQGRASRAAAAGACGPCARGGRAERLHVFVLESSKLTIL